MKIVRFFLNCIKPSLCALCHHVFISKDWISSITTIKSHWAASVSITQDTIVAKINQSFFETTIAPKSLPIYIVFLNLEFYKILLKSHALTPKIWPPVLRESKKSKMAAARNSTSWSLRHVLEDMWLSWYSIFMYTMTLFTYSNLIMPTYNLCKKSPELLHWNNDMKRRLDFG